MKGYITQLGEGYLHGTFMILDIIVDYDEINENLGSLAIGWLLFHYENGDTKGLYLDEINKEGGCTDNLRLRCHYYPNNEDTADDEFKNLRIGEVEFWVDRIHNQEDSEDFKRNKEKIKEQKRLNKITQLLKRLDNEEV